MKLIELQYLHDKLSTQIAAEFTLLGQRMNWLLLSSSFLFTAAAITSNQVNGSANSATSVTAIIGYCVPIVGIVISALSFLSMSVALSVIDIWKGNRRELELKLRQALAYPHPMTVDNKQHGHKVGNLPYLLMPWVIAAAWIVILIAQLAQ